MLFINQAERDILTFLDANNVVIPLMPSQKKMLLDVNIFSYFCVENGKPIMDWMKISKAEFDQFRYSIVCYRGIKKVTIPLNSKILSGYASATIPRASSFALATPTLVSKCLLFSKGQISEDSDTGIAELQHVLDTLLLKAIDSPLVKGLENHGFTTVLNILLLN